MRSIGAALLLCAAASACRFSLVGIGTAAGGDMATVGDLAVGGDLPACGCPTGCAQTPMPHCLALQPSGPVTAGDYNMPGLGVLNVNANITINTDTGAIAGPPSLMRAAGAGVNNGVGFHVVAQSGGPGVGVFSVAGLALASGYKITVGGANAFALASSGAVTIDGTVNAACTNLVPGPGGFAGGLAAMDGAGPASGAGKAGTGGGGGNPASGGGGGGYGDAGGAGGLISAAPQNGGVPWGDLTVPGFVLVGGAGGGGGAATNGGRGGGGGGAVQLAVNGSITISGTINVGGCGGVKAGNGGGGGGAGAGGAIVLEAAHVTLTSTAVLAANGGGGGAGDDMSSNGGDANASVAPAPGGVTTSGTGGNGGSGGASAGMPGQHFTNGRPGLIPNANGFGGGGGGGVGRIAIRSQNPTMGGTSDSSMSVTPDAADANTSGAHPTVYGAASFQ